MRWRHDRKKTKQVRAAGGLFTGYAPVVQTCGNRQLLITEGPLGGVIEMIRLEDRMLIATRSAPPVQSEQLGEIPRRVRAHLRDQGLIPWAIAEETDFGKVLREMASLPKDRPVVADPPSETRTDHRLKTVGELIGGRRRQLAETLVAMVSVEGRRRPLPVLEGYPGAGKRTLADAVCRQLGYAPTHRTLELLQSEWLYAANVERALDHGTKPAKGGIVIVSGADIIAEFSRRLRSLVLAELGASKAILLADGTERKLRDTPGVVSFWCPGLAEQEAGELLQIARPKVELVDAAPIMAFRSASVNGVGILPGRLLWVVDLAAKLAQPSRRGAVRLAGDELAPAIELAHQAWAEEKENEE